MRISLGSTLESKLTADFFHTLGFGGASAPPLFCLPSKRSYWPEDVASAVRLAIELAETQDVYFGVCPQDCAAALRMAAERARTRGLATPKPEATRGFAETTTALFALWVDIDFAEGHHAAKAGLPPRSVALDRVKALPLRPDVVVDSGGGVHAYWILEESFLFKNDVDRREARALVDGWQAKVREVLSPYHLDSTSDLARLLRVPGTLNRKDPANPRPVTLLEDV